MSISTEKKEKGVLVNLTRCIGCGSCTVACKMYNDNRWIEDRAATSEENAQLADENWTVVRKFRVDKRKQAVSGAAKPANNEVWRYVKHQCLHCKEPACASSCFAKAFQKTPEGPVVYYPQLCVGCRYCMVACPFNIPKFEWSKALPKVTKCMFCSSKIEQGELPACVSVCPTNVMKFGDKDDLLQEAKELIAQDSRLIEHIYGEKEAGGTNWIYVSDVPFEELGFKTKIPNKSIPAYTKKYMHNTPIVGAAWFVVLTLLYIVTKPWGKKNKPAAKKEDVV